MPYSELVKGRASISNHAYHVTIATQNREPLFLDQGIAKIATKELQESPTICDVESLAWVVMPDHIHWLLQISSIPLSDVVRRFKGRSARAINQHKRSAGAVWQKGFYDHAIRQHEGLRQTARYIVANPLRAGLVSSVSDYPYWWAVWADDGVEVFD